MAGKQKGTVHKVVEKRPSRQWIELFLAVADLVDGGWAEDFDQNVVDAYRVIFNSPEGRKIYAEACDEVSA
jgi:hypothetical protein